MCWQKRARTCGFTRGISHRNLNGLVSNYLANPLDELYAFENLGFFSAALRHAALARDAAGKKHSHQYRISGSTLSRGLQALRRISRSLRRARSFHELHERIAEAVGSVKGLGPLYTYDAATRLGAYLQQYPERVYLHAGTRDGAKALGLSGGRESLTVDELPTPLRRLAPYQIEDFLCIFKKELKDLQSRRRLLARISP